MSSPDYIDLSKEGFDFLRDLGKEPVTGELPGQLPALDYSIVGQYSRTRQFYVASDIEVAAIETGGMPLGFRGFEEEDQNFFTHQFDEQQLRAFDIPDADKVRGFVLSLTPDGDPKPITLIPDSLMDQAESRTPPEPLIFFLRNLHHLSKLGEVDASVREQAGEIVQKYLSRLVTGGQIESTVYAVDPKSPALISELLGDPLLPHVSPDMARERVRLRQTDQLYVKDILLPEHLHVNRTVSYPAEPTVDRILKGDGMVVFRPTNV